MVHNLLDIRYNIEKANKNWRSTVRRLSEPY